jgi:hypothetical protein
MLLISDSNIIIDMAAGGLLEAMFGLDDEFAVPDVLFAEELEPTYPQLRRLGLKIYELSGKSVEYMLQLHVTRGSQCLQKYATSRQPSALERGREATQILENRNRLEIYS